ncbi:sulfatase [Halorhabdus utahensis DSM 12940]|uniref:Sulfatase n=1 Tax=Halorhabdus utahensis (strain DSM 12940 / JCM 11049 / AX-2) TaxID=519442 RepID=C7NU57_HALUD|nr:sulfatase [Halorhabdus utahensis]ACV12302.1 sulfatase [Halorhabdus utahensis DSM 12940]
MKNVVLLTIDALRADHLSCYGYDRTTTPFLDSFAEQSILFENTYSTSSHTREAMASLLSGTYPDEAIEDDYSISAETVASHLADTHLCGGFHSNPYLSRAFGYDRDFEAFDDDLRLGQNRILGLIQRALDKFVFNRGSYHARASEINERSLNWLDSIQDEEPYFLWNHYMDVHGPYNPPTDYNTWSDPISDSDAQQLYDALSGGEAVSEDDVGRALNLYDGEILYTDALIEEFITELDRRDHLEDTLVLITADHGDLFGEYDSFAHPRYVYPELTRVPLLVRTPETQTGRVQGACSTVDILPTILDWIGQSNEQLAGRSLFDDVESDRVVYSTARGEDDNQHCRRIAANQRGHSHLLEYDTQRETIQHERRIVSNPEQSSANNCDIDWGMLRDNARSFGQVHAESKSAPGSGAEVEEEIERRLDALGYK